MISCKSLFRINLVAWKASNNCVKSKSSHYLQKRCFGCGLNFELKMDVKKGMKAEMNRRKGKLVTQTWRAVSTQSMRSEGDGDKGELQSQLKHTRDAISSGVSTVKCENINPEDSIESRSLEGKLIPLEKYSISMEVGWSLMRFIEGKGGVTQKEIEESGVKITFPTSKNEDNIIIEGNSAESVTKASEKIQIIIDKAVNSRELDYSHFISLPLAIHPRLVEKLINFQNKILGIVTLDKDKKLGSDTGGDAADDVEEDEEDQHSTKTLKIAVELKADKADACVQLNITSDQHSATASPVVNELKDEDADEQFKVNITNIPLVSYSPKKLRSPASEFSSSTLRELGIDKSIFIKPETFHLTVLMLKLWNKNRVKAAVEVLQSVSSRVLDALDNRPISIRLKGLDCMKGSLTKARVLYAPVEEIGDEGRLLCACQVIIDAFIEAGLIIGKDAQQKLKLHATLMNARHGKREKNTRKLDYFDARGIFDQYGSEEWGIYPIREAHLSQRFVFDENGYYHCCSSIPFLGNIKIDELFHSP